jgi:hypothetical protein
MGSLSRGMGFSLAIVFVLEGSYAFVDFVEGMIISGANINIYSSEMEGKCSLPVLSNLVERDAQILQVPHCCCLPQVPDTLQQIAEIFQVAADPTEEK